MMGANYDERNSHLFIPLQYHYFSSVIYGKTAFFSGRNLEVISE